MVWRFFRQSFCLFITCFFALPSTIAVADIVGKANVVSGDILEIAGQNIRLRGVDAAEPGQSCLTKHSQVYHCGRNAAIALMAITNGVEVACRDEKPDPRPDAAGRLIADCFVGRFDLGRQLVLSGFAFAERPGGEQYFDDEDAARRLPEGMWKGKFNMPWQWRAGERLADLP